MGKKSKPKQDEVFIESHAVTHESIAKDAATQLLTAPFIPVGWTASMEEWLVIMRGTQDVILQAIAEAKEKVPVTAAVGNETPQLD